MRFALTNQTNNRHASALKAWRLFVCIKNVGLSCFTTTYINNKEEKKTDAEKVNYGKFLFENHRNE